MRGSRAGFLFDLRMMIITFFRGVMTLKLNFVVQFGSKTISCSRDEFFINERDRDFLAFFAFQDQKILTQTLRENDTR